MKANEDDNRKSKKLKSTSIDTLYVDDDDADTFPIDYGGSGGGGGGGGVRGDGSRDFDVDTWQERRLMTCALSLRLNTEMYTWFTYSGRDQIAIHQVS